MTRPFPRTLRPAACLGLALGFVASQRAGAQRATPTPAADAAPAAAPVATPPPVERPALPAEYAPQGAPPRFNSNVPPFIRDADELSRLRGQVPAWMQQMLAFPSEDELLRHLARDSGGIRERAAADIQSVVASRLLPADFPQHLVPVSRWAILYDDWRKQGGTDVFVTKFEAANDTVVQVLESHNHIVAFFRDLRAKRPAELSAVKARAAEHADVLFVEGLKPVSADAMRLFRTSASPMYVYGWYVPRLEALTGGPAALAAGDTPTTVAPGQPAELDEPPPAARASAVRFFSNGEFSAFMVLKPSASGDTGRLMNPFEPRFQPINARGMGAETPFWESPAAEAKGGRDAETVRRRQIEEYLGSFLYDVEGRKLSEMVPVQDLERAFLEMSRDQQAAIVERKMIDEYLTGGMKAYASRDSGAALRQWTKLLRLDPENPRAAILLSLAVKMRAAEGFGGDTEKARRDRAVADALDAMARQQTALSLRRDQTRLDEARDRAVADFRTRALGFLSENNWGDSLREWEKILKQDPGNPTALFYKDICEDRLREKKDAAAPPRVR